ncbi:AhpA/YtjB family protein [Oceanisphaera sp. W20_SRM_FM3]|uniref:AhpA/YtjB family protein n=1 Tax=Oceanisphaera sp. W20_SRM_FM3 TaxID=3240267 RepID=UPI003F9E80EA
MSKQETILPAMWKRPNYTYLTRPKLLLWLLVLVLLLLTAWQGLQVAKLGHAWQALPQRALATPLADYAESAAIRALLADDTDQAQLLVSELTAAELISSAQLYGEDGRLLAESDAKAAAESAPKAITEPVANNTSAITYVRPLYQDEQPLGFLRLQLANNPLSTAQHSLWRQLEHHLSWLFPLSLVFGLLLGMGLQHWLQRRALSDSRLIATESTEK